MANWRNIKKRGDGQKSLEIIGIGVKKARCAISFIDATIGIGVKKARCAISFIDATTFLREISYLRH
jgi:hypothetical protein